MGVERPQVLTTPWDVVVVGGGPAGLIAARDLASSGHAVLVLEEHDRIGTPVHCTGVLGMDAFEDLALDRRSILGIVHSASFVSADGTTVRIGSDRIRAAVVDRPAFDAQLAESAVAAGATLRTPARVTAIAVGQRSVEVVAAGESLHARACIVACGASYRFNKALGLGVPGVIGHSAQLEVPFPAIDDVEVHFGSTVAPGGFGWVVPFRRGPDTYARVGLVSNGAAAGSFSSLVARLRARHGIEARWGAPRVKALPLSPAPRTWGERVLAVGDAAGLVKPTTGGGIYYGLLTGGIAASVLDAALRSNDLRAGRLKAYGRACHARLGAEIRAGLAFRAVASRLPDRAVDTLLDLARREGIVPVLKQAADFNWHGAAALSLLRNAAFRRVVVDSIWESRLKAEG